MVIIGGGLTESSTDITKEDKGTKVEDKDTKVSGSKKDTPLSDYMVKQLLMNISNEADLVRFCASNRQFQSICTEPTFKEQWRKKYPYTINIIDLRGKKITLTNMHSNTVIAQLAKNIEDEIKLPVDQMRLITQGKTIWNARDMSEKYDILRKVTMTLEQMNIKPGTTIHVVYAM